MGTWFINDFENQNHEYYGAVASPHCPDNFIVATGYCVDLGDIKAHYFHTDEQAIAHPWIDELLNSGAKYYVAHNATFEIQWMLRTYREKFLEFIKRGGRVICTQYAEFLLSHQQELYPRLEDCSIKYGGTCKVDEVKILWEQGVLTADIDEALIMKYLADPVVGDVANTRRVCFAQVKLLREQGMWEMFLERMDSLLFNAMATYNGLYVDMDVASKNQAEQEAQIAKIQESIHSMLPELPTDFEFSFTSLYHRSAFLFGGDINYDAKVSYDPVKFEQVEAYQWIDSVGAEHYVPIEHADLANGEFTRFKAGKSKGEPKVFKIDSDVEKLKWGKKTVHFDGIIDLQALPAIVSDAYLGKRAEFRGKRELPCGTPIYSTSSDSLDVLAVHAPVTKPLKELAGLIKDTGTYYLQVDEKGKKSGMLQYVEPNNIIHHQLNNTSTVTGRLSGSKPNMQNIPRDGTSKVKEMFVSRFDHWLLVGEGINGQEIKSIRPLVNPKQPPFYNVINVKGRIVEVDYSALEVVTLASISGDKNLMRMLVEGIDMHCYRLAAKLKEDYDSVVLKCGDKSHPDHKAYKQMRTDIKPRAFAHQYGASAGGIAYSTGCTIEDAEEFKAIEFKLFPESNAYPRDVVKPAVESTGLKSPLQREQDPDTGIWNAYRRGYFQAKSGTCYSFRQFNQWDNGTKKYVLDYRDTQIANYWCQGEGSFIVQAACGRVIRYLINDGFANGQVLPINTVHDAIYLDCATEALAIKYGNIVKSIMEETPKILAHVIPALKDWNYHVTPFPAQPEMGSNMMNKSHIH